LAADLREEYDPIKHPGYPEITLEEWAEYDRRMVAYQARLREQARRR
jgi:hypothetical protein